jgi:hypothetical protein
MRRHFNAENYPLWYFGSIGEPLRPRSVTGIGRSTGCTRTFGLGRRPSIFGSGFKTGLGSVWYQYAVDE